MYSLYPLVSFWISARSCSVSVVGEPDGPRSPCAARPAGETSQAAASAAATVNPFVMTRPFEGTENPGLLRRLPGLTGARGFFCLEPAKNGGRLLPDLGAHVVRLPGTVG